MKNFVVFILLMFFAGPSLASGAASPSQEKCPVMGYKINKKLFADHEGKRIYFCCSSCPSEFKKDPDKYLKKLVDQGVVLEKAPAK